MDVKENATSNDAGVGRATVPRPAAGDGHRAFRHLRRRGRNWLAPPAGLVIATVALFAAGLGAASPTSAQVGAPPGQGGSPLPPAPPERIEPAPPSPDTPPSVLRPPSGIDPGIRTTVPDPTASTMPVIPPPGTPGGDPGIRPR